MPVKFWENAVENPAVLNILASLVLYSFCPGSAYTNRLRHQTPLSTYRERQSSSKDWNIILKCFRISNTLSQVQCFRTCPTITQLFPTIQRTMLISCRNAQCFRSLSRMLHVTPYRPKFSKSFFITHLLLEPTTTWQG